MGFWKKTQHEVYFTKPVVESDLNRKWYKPGCVQMLRINIGGTDELWMSVAPYDIRGGNNFKKIQKNAGIHDGNLVISLEKDNLEKCRQEHHDQIVIDVSKTRSLTLKTDHGPMMYHHHKNGMDSMFRVSPNGHTQVVDFKLTFNFGEGSENELDLPKLTEGSQGTEWKLWLKLLPPVL